jgi:hypothetical protein
MGASVHNALTSFAWAVPAALALTGLMKVGQLIYQHFHKAAVGGMEIPHYSKRESTRKAAMRK